MSTGLNELPIQLIKTLSLIRSEIFITEVLEL